MMLHAKRIRTCTSAIVLGVFVFSSHAEMVNTEPDDLDSRIAAMENLSDGAADVDTADEVDAPGSAAATESPVVAGREPTAKEKQIEEAAIQEALRRQAQKVHGLSSLRRGQKKLDASDYTSARRLFEEALANLPLTEPVARETAEKGIALTHYNQALNAYRQRDFQSAEQSVRAAIDAGHPEAVDLLHKILNPPEEPVPPPPSHRAKEPEFVDSQRSLRYQLIRARQFYNTREYTKSLAETEKILRDYPYNTEAKRLRQKLYEKVYDDDTFELEATRREMISAVREAWNPPAYGIRLEGPVDPADRGVQPGRDVDVTREQEIVEKMKALKLPSIEFAGANINDVILWLQEQSLELDVDEEDPTKRGVNIILKGSAGAEPPRAGGGGGAFADVGAFEEAGVSAKNSVTIKANYLSLYETLNIVCETTGRKWVVRDSVVLVMDKSESVLGLIRRDYTVMPSLRDTIESMDANDGGDADPFAAEQPDSAKGDKWKKAFERLGVKWPTGSSISYEPSMGKIFVTNTPENLREFENVLYLLNVTPRQIEIEARFVEVQQTDLESLGIEWLLDDAWEIASKNDPTQPAWAQERIVMDANSVNGGFTVGNRFLQDATTLTGGNAVDQLLKVSSVLTNPQFSFVLHMLDQQGNEDLLSAPKVMTKSGQEAEIKMVTKYIYPTDFTVTGLESGDYDRGSSTVGAVVEPGGFETEEVGISLKVKPTVSAEGQMINLDLEPKIVTPPEWKNYGSTYVDQNGNPQQLNMEQPFFRYRSVETELLIYNGATVVMGGLITEQRTEVDDKIPFLGDIPFIGRLFRSTYEHSEKRNLLIFVTARLVDPGGRGVGIKSKNTEVAEAPSTGADAGL